MSNALGIGPAVMINRIVNQAAAPGNHLAQVALVRAELDGALQAEANKALLTGTEAKPAAITTGADVDRLV